VEGVNIEKVLKYFYSCLGNPLFERFKKSVLLTSLTGMVINPAPAWSFTELAPIREYSLGYGLFLPSDYLSPPLANSPKRFFMQIGELDFADPGGLRMDSAEISALGAGFILNLFSACMHSPVGKDIRFRVEPQFISGRRMVFAVSVSGGLLELDDMKREPDLSMRVKMIFRFSSNYQCGYAIGMSRILEGWRHGMSSSGFIGLNTSSKTGLFGAVYFEEFGTFGFSFTGTAVFNTAGFIASYDAGSGFLKGSVELKAHRLSCMFVMGLHPVLGATRGVVVGWNLQQ